MTVGNVAIFVLYRMHGVVVELPRVGDATFGRGELLLQSEEVLVRLEVGIRLLQRKQLVQRAGDHVVGCGLVGHRCSRVIALFRASMTPSSVSFS